MTAKVVISNSDNLIEGVLNLFYTTARADLKVNVAGDTMTGDLTIEKAAPRVILDAATGDPRFDFKLAGDLYGLFAVDDGTKNFTLQRRGAGAGVTETLIIADDSFQFSHGGGVGAIATRLGILSDGVLSVTGTTDYETLVTHDDYIPNKKYVDDELVAHTGNAAWNVHGNTATGDLIIDGNLDCITGAITGINQSVTNRSIPTWNNAGGLRDNPTTWIGASGDWWLNPDGSTDPGFTLTKDSNIFDTSTLLQLDMTLQGNLSSPTFIKAALNPGAFAPNQSRFIDLTGVFQHVFNWTDGANTFTVGGGTVGFPFGIKLETTNATASTAMFHGRATSGTNGNFLRMQTPEGDAWRVDAKGNIFVGGATIHPRGGVGTFSNMLSYSEQQGRTSQYARTSTTAVANSETGPDGSANAADAFTFLGGSSKVEASIAGQTAANNTFTFQGWCKRTSALASTTVRVEWTDDSDSETSPILGIGVIGTNPTVDTWEYVQHTYTFSGTATGEPRVRFSNTDAAGNILHTFGWQVVAGDAVRGYVPTHAQPEAPFIGSVVSGSLFVTSGEGPASLQIHAGDLQSTTNLMEFYSNAHALKSGVNSSFDDFRIDNIKALFGTGNDAAILYDATHMQFFSRLQGGGDFVFNGGTIVPATGTTSTPPIKLNAGTLTTVPEDGAFEYAGGHFFLTSGDRSGITSSVGIKDSNSVATAAAQTVIYSHTFEAGTFHDDQRVMVSLSGVFDTSSASEEITIRFKLEGTAIHSFTYTPGHSAGTPIAWKMCHEGTIRTAGATGKYVDFSEFSESGASPVYASEATEHNIDTTGSVLYEVTLEWTTAKAGNSVTCTQGDITYKH